MYSWPDELDKSVFRLPPGIRFMSFYFKEILHGVGEMSEAQFLEYTKL